MIKSLTTYWREYLMEAWGLGTFMISAVVFTILVEHPNSPVKQALIDDALLRRFIIGIAMGLTAIGIMYSPWGKKSGAHLNPAVTLSFLRLGKISKPNAVFYILFQFIGGYLGVVLFQIFFESYSAIPQVNYAITVPGSYGIGIAFALEATLSFILFITVLYTSNVEKLASLTPIFAGILLTLFITFEAPHSGMSINPARTVASAIPAWEWTSVWLYFLAPALGMWLATEIYLKISKKKNIKCYVTANCDDCKTHLDNIQKQDTYSL